MCTDQICNVSNWISPVLEKGFSASRFLVSHSSLAAPAQLVFWNEGLIFSKSNLTIKLHVAIKTLLGRAQIKGVRALYYWNDFLLRRVAGGEGVMDEISEMVPGGMERGMLG